MRIVGRSPDRKRLSTKTLPAFISVTFTVAAIAKAFQFDHFRDTLALADLIPPALVPATAACVIALEFYVAVGILIPILRGWSLRIGAFLTGLFFAYSLWRAVEHIPVPCNCFGTLFRVGPFQSIALDLALLLTFVVLLTEPDRLRSAIG